MQGQSTPMRTLIVIVHVSTTVLAAREFKFKTCTQGDAVPLVCECSTLTEDPVWSTDSCIHSEHDALIRASNPVSLVSTPVAHASHSHRERPQDTVEARTSVSAVNPVMNSREFTTARWMQQLTASSVHIEPLHRLAVADG